MLPLQLTRHCLTPLPLTPSTTWQRLNVLRANFAKAHEDTLSVEFSHDYLFFYDQLEKANLMLQGVIDCANKPMDDVRVQFFFHHPLGDGGTFCGVSDLAEKYGLVPMSAQPETYSAENTSRASRMIAAKLREFGLELREKLKCFARFTTCFA